MLVAKTNFSALFYGVMMLNVRNIRISDGCVYAQIRKGLGMHMVTYMNCDTVPFLLLVQYKGGLSEIEFTVSLFSNVGMILLSFLKILCISLKKGWNCPFLRGHYKVTLMRYVIETLFIIMKELFLICVPSYVEGRMLVNHSI